MRRLLLSCVLLAAAAPTGTTPTAPSITTLTHDATSGDLMATKSDGTVLDAGLANTRGNNAIAMLGTSGTQTMPCGSNIGYINGAFTSLTVVLSSCPRTNDIAHVATAALGSGLTVQDAAGNTLLTGGALSQGQQYAFKYVFGAWSVYLMPPAALSAAGIATALGYTPLASAPVTSVQGRTGAVTLTSADVTGALGYTPATTAQAGAAAPVQSVDGKTGAVSLSGSYYPLSSNPAAYITQAAITALGLGTASTYAASAFYPATGNPSGFLLPSSLTPYAPLASPALTGTPTAPTATAGTSTTQLATTAFVSTALSALPTYHKVTASVTLSAVTLLSAGFMPAVSVAVSGITTADAPVCSINGTPPVNLLISACQVTAAGTVQVVPMGAAAITLSSQSVSLNFVWWH